MINQTLLRAVRDQVDELVAEKQGFVAAGDLGAAAPPDPSMAQDPAAGGAPPPDPAAAGGAPAPAPAAPAPAAPAAVPGQQPGMPPKPKKVDPAIIDTKLWQIMKLITLMCNHLDIKIPADIILGPAPDPQAMQLAAQDSQNMDAQGQQAAQGTDPAATGGGAGAAPTSAITPPQPIQPAAPMDASGGQKTASLMPQLKENDMGYEFDRELMPVTSMQMADQNYTKSAAALAEMARNLNARF